MGRLVRGLAFCGTVALLGAFGCTATMGSHPELTDRGTTYPPGCDPDGVLPCPDDYFICVEDDDGNKFCEGQRDAAPDGGDWNCEVEDGSIVCSGDHLPEGADAGGWECVESGDGEVTCTTDSYAPGTDDGAEAAWDCWMEGEFIICEQGDYSGEEPPPREEEEEEPPPGVVPDGGGDICFYNADDPDAPPLVHGYYEMESTDGGYAVHVTLVFNPGFVDNTYGVNSADGYRGGPQGHRFSDLVGSDHAEVGFLNGDGDHVLLAKFDYITADDSAPSGYDCLGSWDGDGAILEGSGEHVLDATSSLDRNLNDLGCVYLEDSPTPGECAAWEYRVIYEMWISVDAFGPTGFSRPHMTFVHASPSRTTDTIPVVPGDCP